MWLGRGGERDQQSEPDSLQPSGGSNREHQRQYADRYAGQNRDSALPESNSDRVIASKVRDNRTCCQDSDHLEHHTDADGYSD
jgi:hypothetical protein